MCRQLGFLAEGAHALCCSAYGSGKAEIMLDEVRCMVRAHQAALATWGVWVCIPAAAEPWASVAQGNETELSACAHGAWGVSNCLRGEAVSVRCGAGEEDVEASILSQTDPAQQAGMRQPAISDRLAP